MQKEVQYFLDHDFTIPSSSPSILSQSPTRPQVSVMITIRLMPLLSQTPCCYCQVTSAFVTPDHLLQYIVIPFGLRHAPSTFQRLMSTVLCGVGDCEVYLNDIVAYSST